eukprot:284818917_2
MRDFHNLTASQKARLVLLPPSMEPYVSLHSRLMAYMTTLSLLCFFLKLFFLTQAAKHLDGRSERENAACRRPSPAADERHRRLAEKAANSYAGEGRNPSSGGRGSNARKKKRGVPADCFEVVRCVLGRPSNASAATLSCYQRASRFKRKFSIAGSSRRSGGSCNRTSSSSASSRFRYSSSCNNRQQHRHNAAGFIQRGTGGRGSRGRNCRVHVDLRVWSEARCAASLQQFKHFRYVLQKDHKSGSEFFKKSIRVPKLAASRHPSTVRFSYRLHAHWSRPCLHKYHEIAFDRTFLVNLKFY